MSRERMKAEMSPTVRDKTALPWILGDYAHSFPEMMYLNKAYAVALVDGGVITKEDGAEILKGLDYVEKNLKIEDLNPADECFYFNVEHFMAKKIGPVAGRLHAGRSRNELYATLYRMSVRKTLWPVLARVIKLQKLFLKEAAENVETVITGYTHLQPAQPITLGHYYLAFASTLLRDFQRLVNAYKTTNLSVYGAAALAGNSFPIDRELLRSLLGFDKILVNTLDCVASRDFVIETDMAYTMMMNNMSRFAYDLQIWATDEFSILDCGGEIAGCSSIMPQKKNPISLEYIKSKASHSLAAVVLACSACKNTSFTNTADSFEPMTGYFENADMVNTVLDLAVDTVKYSKFNKELAYERAKKNFCTVTGLADYLVKTYDISFVNAHDIVASMVADVYEKHIGLAGFTGALLQQESGKVLPQPIVMTDAQIADVLDPYTNVQSKSGSGTPRKGAVLDSIGEITAAVADEEKWLQAAIGQVDDAYAKLAKAMANIAP